MNSKHAILMLPGWMGSAADHWQTHWERALGARCVRVEQDDWVVPVPEAWEQRLEARVRAVGGEVSLVAHSLGCHLVARWAATSPLAGRVRSALLVAPPDLEREGSPVELRAWTPHAVARLPFRSVVGFSSNDPHCTPERAIALASCWGSTTHDFGPRGHLNAASGLGHWREGYAILRRLLRSRESTKP